MEKTVKQEYFTLSGIPAILYGTPSESVYLFLHGKMGRKEEGEAFAQVVCPKGWQVLSIDLPEHGERAGEAGFDPWHVVPELRGVLAYAQARWHRIGLQATSLGAWFAMVAFAGTPLDRALFLSPVVDMAGLIEKMMGWAGVSEEALAQAGELPTDFGGDPVLEVSPIRQGPPGGSLGHTHRHSLRRDRPLDRPRRHGRLCRPSQPPSHRHARRGALVPHPGAAGLFAAVGSKNT